MDSNANTDDQAIPEDLPPGIATTRATMAAQPAQPDCAQPKPAGPSDQRRKAAKRRANRHDAEIAALKEELAECSTELHRNTLNSSCDSSSSRGSLNHTDGNIKCPSGHDPVILKCRRQLQRSQRT